MSNSTNKKHNIKQVLVLIFFAIIIVLGIFTNNNYNENDINNNTNVITEISYSLDNIPEYSTSPFVVINDNKPNFEEKDFATDSFEYYSDLDDLGRCGFAFANLSRETMPKENESRKSLDSIVPSGWKDTSYEEIDLQNLYNKCHLIAFSLSAENLNNKNIITGTRYFNVSGMLPFELKALNYLKENKDNHVLYRVTPFYEGENKVASGVTIEIASVEDKGEKLHYYVYVYNVQPEITIDYKTGESKLAE